MSVLDCHLLDPPVLCISLPCQLRVPEHFRAAYCIVVCEGRDMDMQFKLLVSQATSQSFIIRKQEMVYCTSKLNTFK